MLFTFGLMLLTLMLALGWISTLIAHHVSDHKKPVDDFNFAVRQALRIVEAGRASE